MAKEFIENKEERVLFTEEMRKDYTILVPNMLPIHFEMIVEVFRSEGYKIALLEDRGKDDVDMGVRYVHNDFCYPAICSIGQLLNGFENGGYDKDKTALIISQTGGGCRASNYLAMIRKALKRAGYGHVPVLSLNFSGLEKHPGFKMTPRMIAYMVYSVVIGDVLMCIRNQTIVRELEKGRTEALTAKWTGKAIEMIKARKMGFRRVKKLIEDMCADFAAIPLGDPVVRVGIVGEIYVKFAPLGNNNLEDFLHKEGAETVVPGLLDFCYYVVHNNVLDKELYGIKTKATPIFAFVDKIMCILKRKMNEIIETAGFKTLGSYEHLLSLAKEKDCVNMGMKMGEGWLLTSEMLELCDNGIKNIVCTQPFGCLPNHIVGKGMMRPVKNHYPDANIIAIDYDPGASRINQENRLKLMLANARK